MPTIPSINLSEKFLCLRLKSESICKPLLIEDYSVQPSEFASPPKWHLAHSTWFWEEFVLTKYDPNYTVFNTQFSYLFNSYYNTIGTRVQRAGRGLMTRPSVGDIYDYRKYVTTAMTLFFKTELSKEIIDVIEIGMNHEEQHQELLIYDIKYILGMQPTFPIYGNHLVLEAETEDSNFLKIEEGVYEIGHSASSFCFDNELGRHKVYICDFEIANRLVTNREYLEFINSGGYSDFNFWHDEGWKWVNDNEVNAPLYWLQEEQEWKHYTFDGLKVLDSDLPVMHLSYYEAFAYAAWKGMRLPTEFEWEIASNQFNWGKLWEWTNSAYLPYPQFSKASGALGEYNGKFMVNQIVLRGASIATADNHSRNTYRNFFHPDMRWQFCGLRLAK
ncbi:ergothioneine biosynthesis protein EgtB [Flavobacterium algicola]|uniref:ergothioneine biosynthesis protein EgtB n=1 Tax=Flavobacterium algicola TaxID=556529 RepID=UPI001EFD62FE|nr:ergothioneine biosynthesis protein EgtB [Flavobacterium algicola]MCG9793033.1 ergothioneine biosynthesis protein EgtB [Flavobacterium algicola]